MAISIRVLESAEAGKGVLGPWGFKEHAGDILIGRDPEACHVIFPPDRIEVGRRHLALREQLGRYRLILNDENVVLLDGEQALDGQEVPAGGAILQLGTGRDAPRLRVEPAAVAPGLHSTAPHEGKITGRGLLADLRRRSVLMAGVAAVLALGVLFLVLRQRETEQRIEFTVASLAELGAESRARLAGLDARVEAADPAVLARVAEEARPSVLLVLLRDASGRETPIGTAWVAAPGKVATNAHVAEVGLEDPELELLVRSPVAPFQTWPVASVRLHPGYGSFEQLLQDYQPFALSLRGSEEKEFVTVCDVAVMDVVEPESLPPPLAVADASRVSTLRAGSELVLVGYPTENIAGGGVNPAEPTATVQVGRLTAVTNPFLGKPSPTGDGAADDGILLHHSIPSAGGASGSPVLDREGRVVGLHSAGNFIFLPGLRIPSASMINYAQRVDLLAELFAAEDTLQAVQERRVSAWQAGLQQFHSLNSPEGRLADVLQSLEPATARQIRLERLTLDEALEEGLASDDGSHGRLLRLRLPPERDYLAIAMAPEDAEPDEPGVQREDLHLFVLSRERGRLLFGEAYPPDWFRVGWFRADPKLDELEILLRGRADLPAELSLYEIIAPPEDETNGPR